MKLYEDQIIVVTGAAGFIGSSLVRHLNQKGIKNLVIVDDLGKSEKWKNLVGKQLIEIVSRHRLFDWFKGRESLIAAFIHLGACSSTVETDADYLLENNTRFSMRLADYALDHAKRFIYASSAATYGDGSAGFSDDEDRLDDLAPMNMYGFSKHLFDLWLKNHGMLHKVVGLKYFNVFGPNEYHKGRMSSAVLQMLPQARDQGVVRLFKSSDPSLFAHGEQKRDFIYVKDAVKMTCAFLDHDCHGIFNIGSGVASSWNEMARALFKALNQPVNIQYIDMPPDLIGKYQNFTCAEMKKTLSALRDDSFCRPFEETIVEYVKEYLLQEKRW